ncbi:hypothetical protein HDU78_010587 [Chytriomyces hyalinus]|nr:hypothetical protein HDU78_010587 [Chytriomyces hyalinus]
MPDGDAAADGYEELSGEDCYDTRSPRQRRKPGRKQTTSEPLTKKQEQTRRAQRNFRERQQKYVQSLEGKAEELAAVMAQERKEAAELRRRITQLEMDLANAVAAGSNPQTSNPVQLRTEHCTSSACAAERSLLAETVGDLRLEIDSMRVRMEKAGRLVASPPPPHQTKLAQISSLSEGATEVLAPSMCFSPSQTSPQSSRHAFQDGGWNDDSTKNTSNSPMHPFPYNHSPPPPTNKVKSATEMYGSPQVEFARQMCKSIPSLANCKEVDDMYSLFLVQAKCTDTAMLLKYHVQIVRAWYKVFDAVKDVPAERKSLLEVDEVFHLINKDHMNHFYSIAAFAASNSIRPPRSLSTGGQTESWTLSLQNLRIDLYSLPSLSQSQVLIETLLETFSRPASLGFFENSALVRQLERQCNSEDRGLFLSALYKLRTADKVMHDAAFEQVLISLDGIAIS